MIPVYAIAYSSPAVSSPNDVSPTISKGSTRRSSAVPDTDLEAPYGPAAVVAEDVAAAQRGLGATAEDKPPGHRAQATVHMLVLEDREHEHAVPEHRVAVLIARGPFEVVPAVILSRVLATEVKLTSSIVSCPTSPM